MRLLSIGSALGLVVLAVPYGAFVRQSPSSTVVVIDVSPVRPEITIPVPKPLPLDPLVPRLSRVALSLSAAQFLEVPDVTLAAESPSWHNVTAEGCMAGTASASYPYDILDPPVASCHGKGDSEAPVGLLFYFYILNLSLSSLIAPF